MAMIKLPIHRLKPKPFLAIKSLTKALLRLQGSDLAFALYLFGIAVLYSFQLEQFPLFADEAIYLHWAKRIFIGDEHWFISMFDGKPPLFIWLTNAIYALTHHLILSGRLVSVAAVILLTSFFYQFFRKFYSSAWAWISVILFNTSPFIFFHSRLAIMDMLMSSLLMMGVLAWSQPTFKYRGWLSGVCFGLAFMTKTPVLFVLPLPILSFLLFDRSFQAMREVLKMYLMVGIGAGLLATSIWFPFLFSRSSDFTFHPLEVWAGQTDHILTNATTFISWLSFYESWMILGLAGLGCIWAVTQRQKLLLQLILAFLLFTVPFIGLGKVLFARYYLFSGLSILLLASYMISRFPMWLQIISLSSILIWAIPTNLKVLINPLNAYLVEKDQVQYLKDWSSGIGLKEAAVYVREKAKTQKVKVVTEGYYGTLPDGLFVYLDPLLASEQLEIVGVGTTDSEPLKQELLENDADLIYYVGNKNRIGVNHFQDYKLVQSYPKLGDGPPLQIYRLK